MRGWEKFPAETQRCKAAKIKNMLLFHGGDLDTLTLWGLIVFLIVVFALIVLGVNYFVTGILKVSREDEKEKPESEPEDNSDK